jgi:hypothetical protein
MEHIQYNIRDIKDWKEFKNFVDNLSFDWIFRGQANSNWTLKTSLERTNFIQKYSGIETSFLSDFQRAAGNFLNEKEIPTTIIEWLALMQHHGAPTRLVDFTKSPYTASYFAFEQIDDNVESVAIWGIDTSVVTNKLVEYLLDSFREDFIKSHYQISHEIFEKLFLFNDKECIVPIEPFYMNKRYYLQQSFFLSSGNAVEPFMSQFDFLDNDKFIPIIKFILTRDLQNEVLIDLEKMNINRATLFPDLDGYARSLKVKYSIMKDISEILSSKQRETIFLSNEKINNN